MITNEMARLIREADVKVHLDLDDGFLVILNLDKFAALVAAAEREACAKVCGKHEFALSAADEIRARGNK